MNYVDAAATRHNLGVAFRKQQPGPESELVEYFLRSNPVYIPRGSRLTVFREPHLQSGSPDLVLVVWNEATAGRWTADRTKLTRDDMRLMHYLVQVRRASFAELQSLVSCSAKSGLQRLHAAEMVRLRNSEWEPRSLSRIFAVKAIIAIEAKISEWRAAVQQAFLNRWFASSSYVLVPHIPQRSNLLNHASSRGVGVLSLENAEQKVPVSSSMPPRSYASWLFNEWAWKASRVAVAL
jgi:hypothetical protein